MKLFIKMILIAVIGFSVPVGAALAENPAGDYLVELGEKFYERGNLEDALHEFSKALIVDPDNKKAREYMAKHGLTGGLYQKNITAQSRLVDMAQITEGYKAQVKALNTDIDAIKAQLSKSVGTNESLHKMRVAKELELSLVQQKFNAVDQAMKVKDVDFKAKMAGIEAEYANKMDTLNAQIQDLKEQPVEASENLAAAVKNEELVQQLKDQLNSDFHANMDYERKIKSLLSKNEELKEYSQDVYSWHQRTIGVLEDYLRLRELSVNDMQDAVVAKHTDLTSAQSSYFNRVDELVRMHEILSQYLAKLDEREKDMAAKEADVDALRLKLAEAQKRIVELTEEKE